MENPRADARLLGVALSALALVLWTVTVRYAPPDPLPQTADPAAFSADRAYASLRRVLGQAHPHPTGSAENEIVWRRIAVELKTLGYTPHIHSAFVCRHSTCGNVRNVVARLRGKQQGNAVVIAVHHDSVAAGPGATDDGQGVASGLEIARSLKHHPQPRHDVILLFDDGEEWGLLGAEAFMKDHPWAKSASKAVVVDSRGTTGSSLLFETSPENRWLVDMVATEVKRPTTNSIYYTIYKMLPNDTDFTVFKESGLDGVNFASVGGSARYHTPRDDLAHFDRRTLQHSGENALAMVLALSNGNEPPGSEDAVFFDLFTWKVIRWNQSLSPFLAATSLALLIVVVIVLIRQRRVQLRSLLWGLSGLLVTAGAAYLIGLAVLHTLRAVGAVPSAWLARPSAFIAAFWIAPLVGATLSATLLRTRAGALGLWCGAWLIWGIGALVLSLRLPGFCYPFLIGSLLAGVGGLVLALRRADGLLAWALASILPLLASASLLFPLAWLFYDGLGTALMPAVAAVVAVVVHGLSPLLAEVRSRWRWLIGFGGALLLIITTIVAANREPFSVDSPQGLPLVLHFDADAKHAQWMAETDGGDLPPQLRSASSFKLARPLPWQPELEAYVTPAAQTFAAPEFDVLESSLSGGNKTLRGVLRSPRGAAVAGLIVPRKRFLKASIDGEAVFLRPGQQGEWVSIRHITLPDHGGVFQITLTGPEPVEFILFDRASLNGEGVPLIKVRPEWAVPNHAGDRSLVTRRVRL